MKKLLLAGAALACAGVSAAAIAASSTDSEPLWAWGFTTPIDPSVPFPKALPVPPVAPPAPGQQKHTIPGSKFSFTRSETSDRNAPGDWFPDEHPPMPDIVAHGKAAAEPTVYACALCHMPDGRGRPENANLTGLPYDYILRQLQDFKDGNRQTSDKRKVNTEQMASFTKSMTDDEMKAAAKYFASIPAPKWVKVVESKTAPKTRAAGGVFLTLEGKDAGSEPLGNRIVETPLVAEDFELWRNPHSGFVAYVPVGSVAKGKALVGGAKSTACTTCHGQDLRGLGPVPRLAGRSPSYIVRQIYDMQHGNRIGAWMPLMAPVIDKLNQDDVMNISAYLASLDP